MTSAQADHPAITEESVRAALRGVPYPGLNRDLVTFGMVDHVSVCGSLVKVRLAMRARDESTPRKIRDAVAAAVNAIGASQVTVEIVPPAAAYCTGAFPASSPNRSAFEKNANTFVSSRSSTPLT